MARSIVRRNGGRCSASRMGDRFHGAARGEDQDRARRKSFPLFGKVVDVTWQGEDYATRLISVLANDPAVKSFVKKTGDVEIESHAGGVSGLDRAGQWQVLANPTELGHRAEIR